MVSSMCEAIADGLESTKSLEWNHWNGNGLKRNKTDTGFPTE